MSNEKILPYSNVIIRLLQGVIYKENDKLWNMLIININPVTDYFMKIGVELVVSENDGYAFIRNIQVNDDVENTGNTSNNDENNFNLFTKRALGFHISLLCVLLTRKLLEFDMSSKEQSRLIISRSEIKELFSVYLPDTSNEAKVFDILDSNINKLIEYGFLKKLGDSEFEVRRILKAKFSGDILNEINRKLDEYSQITND